MNENQWVTQVTRVLRHLLSQTQAYLFVMDVVILCTAFVCYISDKHMSNPVVYNFPKSAWKCILNKMCFFRQRRSSVLW